MHHCTWSRISLCLIAITACPSPELSYDRDRGTCRGVGIDRERDSRTTWKGRRSGEGREARGEEEREGGCPNGIRIGMGREPCTKQPRRHPAFARIATLAPWLAHGKHCVSGAEADLAQSGRPLSWDPPPRSRLRLQHRCLYGRAVPNIS